jgi:hypothetical protein
MPIGALAGFKLSWQHIAITPFYFRAVLLSRHAAILPYDKLVHSPEKSQLPMSLN